MRNVEEAQSKTTKPETTFEKMLNAIRDCLSDLPCSEHEVGGEDMDDDAEDTELGKLSEDVEPGWEMGKISKMVQHRMESFCQKQMRLDKLTQPGCRDAADYFRERDKNYGTIQLKVPAVVKPHTSTTAATPSLITYGELMKVLDIIPGQSQMPQVMSPQESSQLRLSSEEAQADNHIVSLMSDAVPNSSQRETVTPGQTVSIYSSV